MYFMSLNVDSGERTSGTNILAGTAAYTGFLVDDRHHGRLLVILVEHHHLNGSCWAVAGTVATLHAVGDRHTVLLDPHGMAYLDRRLLGLVYLDDGSCGTDFRTTCTLRTAVTALIRHHRQHQVHQIAAGAEHLIGALRHTKLATRAVLGKMIKGERTRRRQRCLTF